MSCPSHHLITRPLRLALARSYGATLLSIKTPDREGALAEVTLNRDTVDGLLHHNAYYGSSVGRVANRIAAGRFSLEGRDYQLAANNGPNHLHGGVEGFDRKLWAAEPFKSAAAVGVRFRLQSPHGEEGYPGNLAVQVRTPSHAHVLTY